MVDQRLVDYVKQQKAAGYSEQQIRQAMLQYGYDQASVDAAFSSGRPKLPVIPILIGVLVVLIITASIFLFSGKAEPDIKMDITLRQIVTEAEPGRSFSFNVDIIGVSDYVDIEYTLYGPDNQVVLNDEESVSRNSLSSIALPSDIRPGDYELFAEGEYEGRKSSDSLSFSVIEKNSPSKTEPEEPEEPEDEPLDDPAPSRSCPASCDDGDRCTRDECSASTDFRCEHNDITPCCGNGICESAEDSSSCSLDCRKEEEPLQAGISVQDVVEEVKKKSSNPASAVSYCNGLSKEYHRDSCFNAAAEETKDSTMCERINSGTTRDNCYTNFALEGDYTVCEKLENKYLKASCESLKEAN